jgi:hypothetical protein
LHAPTLTSTQIRRPCTSFAKRRNHHTETISLGNLAREIISGIGQ